MTKQLYIIDYENAHWCGGQLNVCVWADSPTEASLIAEDHMIDAQRELFYDEYAECEEGEDEDCPYTINDIEVMDKNHECWEFFNRPDQSEFYPVIGTQDA